MGKKDHTQLSVCFENQFPELLGFEECAILMTDMESGALYKISLPYLSSASSNEGLKDNKTS